MRPRPDMLSGALFLIVLVRGQMAARSVALREPRTLPAALNGFGLWLGLMVALTIVNYGFPIAHALATPETAVPAVRIGVGR
jgi:cytochrome c oxidase subunit I